MKMGEEDKEKSSLRSGFPNRGRPLLGDRCDCSASIAHRQLSYSSLARSGQASHARADNRTGFVANMMIVKRRKVYDGRDAVYVLGYEPPLSVGPGAQKWWESTKGIADDGVRIVELAPHPVSPT
ncbi:hypothetical protein U1Q18_030466 [Sarracenia purpurea var. burkii]